MNDLEAGWQYARDVGSGKIPACKSVQLACLRALSDLQYSDVTPDSEWEFSDAAANHFLQFCTFIFHVKGDLAGIPFKLEAWQVFLLSQIFGWKRRSNREERRFREVLIEVGRKNGKSFLCSAVALYDLLFGDEGAEIYSVATKIDQAKIVWESAGRMAKKMDSRLAGKVAQTVSAITCEERFSTFKPLARDSKSLDGLNPSLVIIDEAGAIEDRNVIEVMTSSLGARVSPLIIYITTAYFSKSTAYYEKRKYAKSILEGAFEDDRIFAMIYSLDEDDDYRDSTTWIKANPNLGVSISEDYLSDVVRQAEAVSAQRPSVLVKHFNLWQSAQSAWLDTRIWEDAPSDVDRSGACYIGMDLAQTRDLTAVTRLWHNGDNQYSVDFLTWLPRFAIANAPPHIRPIYNQAIESGLLRVTEGLTTNYNEIEQYVEQTCQDFDVHAIASDPYNANQLVNNLEDRGHPVLLVRQGISHLSPASKQTEIWLTEKRIAHGHDPFTLWQLGNCSVYTDLNSNIKVRKGEDVNLKIDSIIALIMAISAAAGNAAAPKEFHFEFLEL